MTLFNEKNEIIATGENLVDFNVFSSTTVFQIPTTKSASVVSVTVLAMKGDKELASYSTVLTDLSKNKNKGLGILGYCILFILILMVIIGSFSVVRSKKASKVILPILFFVLTSFVGAGVAYSRDGTPTPTIPAGATPGIGYPSYATYLKLPPSEVDGDVWTG